MAYTGYYESELKTVITNHGGKYEGIIYHNNGKAVSPIIFELLNEDIIIKVDELSFSCLTHVFNYITTKYHEHITITDVIGDNCLFNSVFCGEIPLVYELGHSWYYGYSNRRASLPTGSTIREIRDAIDADKRFINVPNNDRAKAAIAIHRDDPATARRLLNIA